MGEALRVAKGLGSQYRQPEAYVQSSGHIGFYGESFCYNRMRARSEATSRTVEEMKSMSAEATELSKHQQDLSRLRAEIIARGETRGQ